MKRISLLLVLCMLLTAVPMKASASVFGPEVSVSVGLDDYGNISASWANPGNVDYYVISVLIGNKKLLKQDLAANDTQYSFQPTDLNVEYAVDLYVNYKDGSFSTNRVFFEYALPAPTDLKAAADSSGKVTLTWNNHTKYISGFEISEEGNNGDGGVTKLSYTGQSSYTFEKAGTAGETYTYAIRAINSYGASDYSNKATLTLPNAPSDAPSDCTAKLQRDGSAMVTWKDNSSWETGFTVQRVDSNGKCLYFDAPANAISYVDAYQFSNGMNYTYSVFAHDSNGQSGSSNTASVAIMAKTPEAPDSLTAKENQDKIILTWMDNPDNETGFVLKRTDDRNLASTSTTLAAGTATYTDAQAITAGITYTYELKAFNDAGS